MTVFHCRHAAPSRATDRISATASLCAFIRASAAAVFCASLVCSTIPEYAPHASSSLAGQLSAVLIFSVVAASIWVSLSSSETRLLISATLAAIGGHAVSRSCVVK